MISEWKHFDIIFPFAVKTDELEDIKRRLNETSEKLEEKNRQYAKLQVIVTLSHLICIALKDAIQRVAREPVICGS